MDGPPSPDAQFEPKQYVELRDSYRATADLDSGGNMNPDLIAVYFCTVTLNMARLASVNKKTTTVRQLLEELERDNPAALANQPLSKVVLFKNVTWGLMDEICEAEGDEVGCGEQITAGNGLDQTLKEWAVANDQLLVLQIKA